MTADERLALIWHKIERANKHIRDLGAAIASFNASNPYRVEKNSQAGLPYYISAIQPVPMEIPIILGDTIQNLRTALDYLAQQLYLAGSGATEYRKETSFFIASKASEYKRLLGGKVQGMRQEAIDALCALEPYKGGKGHAFWTLHSLNNIDKHRTLVAVGSGFRSVDLVPMMMVNATPEERAALKKYSFFIRPANYVCPLKVGDELPVGFGVPVELNPYMKFRFDVALYEPEIIKPGPMLEIVQHLADLVSNTVRAFKPLLA